MADFTVAGQSYKSGKMDAIKQSHVVRRLTPVAGSIKQAFDLAGQPETFSMVDAIPIMSKVVSEMSDEHWEYILYACLDITQRQQGTAWTRIRMGNSLMFEDIQLSEMMQIVWSVLNDNLANFISALLAQISAQAKP
jgi:hypothetical protein